MFLTSGLLHIGLLEVGLLVTACLLVAVGMVEGVEASQSPIVSLDRRREAEDSTSIYSQ